MSYLYERPYVEFRLGRTQADAIEAVSVLGGTGDGEQFKYLFPALNLITSQTGYDKNYFVNTINDSTLFGDEIKLVSNSYFRYGYKIGAGKWSLDYRCDAIVKGNDSYADNVWVTATTGGSVDKWIVDPDVKPDELDTSDTTFTKLSKEYVVLPYTTTTVGASTTTAATETSKFIVRFRAYMEFEYTGSSMIAPTAGNQNTWNRTHGCKNFSYKLVYRGP